MGTLALARAPRLTAAIRPPAWRSSGKARTRSQSSWAARIRACPNDTIFDQTPGSIFGVRVAGNYVNIDGLGSIEYGVAVLKALLIVVLGHEGCGAVKAAVAFAKDGSTPPGHIADVVAAIAPAAIATQNASGDWVHNAIVENVRMNMNALTLRSSILRDAKKSGAIDIVGGVYNIGTAKVEFFQ